MTFKQWCSNAEQMEALRDQFEREWNSQLEWKRTFGGMSEEGLAIEKACLRADFPKHIYNETHKP